MSRTTPVNPAKATGKTKALFDAVQKKFGMIPNLVRTMAHSPSSITH